MFRFQKPLQTQLLITQIAPHRLSFIHPLYRILDSGRAHLSLRILWYESHKRSESETPIFLSYNVEWCDLARTSVDH